MICDFHSHSTASDGVLAPEALVERARESGVDVLALTDHDCVAGLPAACARAKQIGLELMPGIELSVSEQEGARQIHILGLGIDPDSAVLLECVSDLHRRRLERGQRIVELLEGVGITLSFVRVREIAGEGSLGRPHVAKALVEAGLCRNLDQAFSRFLGRGRPAYVPSAGLGAGAAIRLIHAAGGIASLAHPPRSVGLNTWGGLQGMVSDLARQGLDALEVHHPSHKPNQRKRLRQLARDHDLVVTGGSDFHGSDTPPVELGRGRGNIQLGAEILLAIQGRLTERRSNPGPLTPPDPPGTLADPA